MDKKVVVINIGSRSKKYAYFAGSTSLTTSGGEMVANLELEGLAEDSFDKFLEQVDDLKGGNLNDVVIGIRIVAPGKIFTEHLEIDSEYLEKLKEAGKIAPLHIEPVVMEIEYIKNKYNGIKIFAASDSAFHKSIPEYAKIYAIPKKLREEYEIERQGYHGLSLSSAVSRLQKELGTVPEKMIICHLGGGSSITALLDGISVDTSMGWTPLEGVPMAERSGSMDPGVIAFVSEKMSLKGQELGKFLSTECGLEALSGIDKGDIRALLEMEGNDSEAGKKAKLALDVYIYSIKKEIGKMASILNGCDTLVLTGAISEKNHKMRERIVKNLEYLGISLNLEKNQSVEEVQNLELLGLDNNHSIIVVPADEMNEIYKIVSNIGAR